jgi:hypothetical protein
MVRFGPGDGVWAAGQSLPLPSRRSVIPPCYTRAEGHGPLDARCAPVRSQPPGRLGLLLAGGPESRSRHAEPEARRRMTAAAYVPPILGVQVRGTRETKGLRIAPEAYFVRERVVGAERFERSTS